MKGFGIYVKNNLLDPKHVEKMGVAVWLYMWFLDKMTSISEEGWGLILGGKPIKYEEVAQELGVSVATYRRWVADLKKGGYVKVTRTPYGLLIRVNKAEKIFKKTERYIKSNTSLDERDISEISHLSKERYITNKPSNKDNTNDNTIADAKFSAENSTSFKNPIKGKIVSGKTPRHVESPSKRIKRLLQEFNTRYLPTGKKVPYYNKQAKAIQDILQNNYTEEELWDCANWINSQEFFKGFDFMTISTQIGKYMILKKKEENLQEQARKKNISKKELEKIWEEQNKKLPRPIDLADAMDKQWEEKRKLVAQLRKEKEEKMRQQQQEREKNI